MEHSSGLFLAGSRHPLSGSRTQLSSERTTPLLQNTTDISKKSERRTTNSPTDQPITELHLREFEERIMEQMREQMREFERITAQITLQIDGLRSERQGSTISNGLSWPCVCQHLKKLGICFCLIGKKMFH